MSFYRPKIFVLIVLLISALGLYSAQAEYAYVDKLTKTDIEKLKEIPDLKISIFEANDETLLLLGQLTNIVGLDLSGAKIHDLTALKHLTHLEELNLSESEVNDISALTDLVNLKKLNLTGTEVADISPICHLPKLESLVLMTTDVKDITPLKGLSQLKSLNLMGTRVANTACLTSMTDLEELFIGHTLITDENVDHIAQLKKLSYLNLAKTDVSAEGQAKIQQAIPGIYIHLQFE